jgi:hypothetical protein
LLPRRAKKPQTITPPLIACDLSLHFYNISTYNMLVLDIYSGAHWPRRRREIGEDRGDAGNRELPPP